MKCLIFCFSFFSLLLLMLSCSSDNKHDCNQVIVVNLDTVQIQDVSLSNLYSEIEFIPMDNVEEALFGRVSSMDVSEKGIIILDKTSLPKILQFDSCGKFIRNIGRIGNARGEYQHNVTNIGYSNCGDTIFIVTFNGLLLYNKDGSFLSSKSLNDQVVVDFKAIPSGYVYSTRYFGANDYILHFWNDKFENVKEILPVDDYGIGDWGICIDPLCISDSNLYYYNEYNSDIYKIDIHSMKLLKCIKLSSKHSLSLSRFTDEKNKEVYEEPIDLIYSYMAHGDKLYGDFISHENGNLMFELCTTNNEIKLYNIGNWHPNIKANFGGYCYDVIDQNEFLNISTVYDCEKSLREIDKCNYFDIKDSITEKSNFIIVKTMLKYSK